MNNFDNDAAAALALAVAVLNVKPLPEPPPAVEPTPIVKPVERRPARVARRVYYRPAPIRVVPLMWRPAQSWGATIQCAPSGT